MVRSIEAKVPRCRPSDSPLYIMQILPSISVNERTMSSVSDVAKPPQCLSVRAAVRHSPTAEPVLIQLTLTVSKK